MSSKKLNLKSAIALLDKVAGQALNSSQRAEQAVKLAATLLHEANNTQTFTEKRLQAQLSRMMDDSAGKQFTINMTDECFRSEANKRIASQIVHLLKEYGVPRYLNLSSRLQMSLFKYIGEPAANLLIPLIKNLIRQQTAKVILPGEREALKKHIVKRKKQGITTNLNHLGEAILGEDEAAKKMAEYLSDLEKECIEYISIKISTLCSQLNLLAWDNTLNLLKNRLRKLYRAAIQNSFTDIDGTVRHKFINLDMEEYRDLNLTLELFQQVLDEDEFLHYRAGIVLQAYLPDSLIFLQKLTKWSKKRMSRGGCCIKVRIVKGANLAMEKIEAANRHWSQAPYDSKKEVDANFKRLLLFGTEASNAQAVNLGIASHNLFDISYALLLISERQVQRQTNFEMLEGMAEHIRTVVQSLSHEMILYCPAAEKDDFQHAIAYLIRRLDENTSPENFLRHAFSLEPGTKHFDQQAHFFLEGCEMIDSISIGPRRKQNRMQDPKIINTSEAFQNEADTDFSLPDNRHWANSIYRACQDLLANSEKLRVPLVINAQICHTALTNEGLSPNTGTAFFTYSLANEDLVEQALTCAFKVAPVWACVTLAERCQFIFKAANIIRRQRAELCKVMMVETAKTLMEADVEVSEAIDFCEYYARNAQQWETRENLHFKAKGAILVTPPWNFPCAIPLGGIVAALVTGNPVIFKPAPEATLTGWHIAQILYNAGIPQDVLQFIACADSPHGSTLVKDPRIQAVVLTGATETAQLFMNMRPGLDLMAETGGKNCMIITDMCDRDLAISDLLQSAFSHAGQKCSACSLAILEKNVYEDETFLKTLADAAASLKVGLSTDPKSQVNPLIKAPEGKLLRALTKLEDGEKWLLKPQQDQQNPYLWSPGIKLGVSHLSYTFTNEFFGPVLGLVKAADLNEAIALANSSVFGLTGGIHSLDHREQQKWLKHIKVGNAYINRSITGAIVNRQPFGGIKNSSFGRGFKAGGPNYLLQFVNIYENCPPEERSPVDQSLLFLQKSLETLSKSDLSTWQRAAENYQYEYNNYFGQLFDASKIRGQDNFLRYTAMHEVTVIINDRDAYIDVYRCLVAALICQCPVRIAATRETLEKHHIPQMKHSLISVQTVTELDDLFQQNIFPEKIRLFSEVSSSDLKLLTKKHLFQQAIPVYSSGRLELLHYLTATTVSDNYHRYGNLGNNKRQLKKVL